MHWSLGRRAPHDDPSDRGGTVQLALSVISRQSQRLGETSYHLFDARGGSIGRGKQCDWVLDDPDLVLSTRHAAIRFEGGRFVLEDTSTNGTGLNRADALVPRGQAVPLNDGDRLFLGDFELLAQIIADPAPPRVTTALPRLLDYGVPPSLFSPPESSSGSLGDILNGERPAPMAVLPPVGYDTPVSPDAPAPSIAPQGAGPVDLGSLLRAIGVEPTQVPPEMARQLGSILRVVTQGLMDVLRARAEVKNQFRMSLTVIRPIENNPLKFARNVEDVLHTLFVKQNRGFVGPVEAYQEAFDDLGRHQLAMLAGMQAAFGAVLQRFNPEMVEASCDKLARNRTGLIGRLFKPRYWEFFKSHFAAIAHDSDATFQQVFGEAFVRAYDDQIRRLEDVAASHRRR